MKYNKFVAPIMAGALSLSLGLVGCGSNQAATETKTETAETTAESSDTAAETTETAETAAEATDAATDTAADATASSNVVLYWSGETSDGDTVLYSEDETNNTATILLFGTHDGSDEVLGASGPAKLEGDQVIISDEQTKKDFTFTIVNMTEGGMDVDLGEHGTGTLIATTEESFQKGVEDTINEVGAAIEEAVNNISVKDLQNFANQLNDVIQDLDSEGTGSTTDNAATTDSATATDGAAAEGETAK